MPNMWCLSADFKTIGSMTYTYHFNEKKPPAFNEVCMYCKKPNNVLLKNMKIAYCPTNK